MRSLVVLAAACVALVVGPALPAAAHGAALDGTDFRSVVTGVVDADGAPADLAGVAWRVVGSDAPLEVSATGGTEVVVAGYDGEPYLRVGPDGVFENRNSPATWLNADRYGNVAVPADVDPDAAPDWQRVGDGPAWRWHDHRIHWMAPSDPPAVRAEPDRTQEVLAWSVPFTVDGRTFAATGRLDYVPPPPVWPWLLVAAAVLGVPVAAAASRSAPVVRRVAAIVITLVALGGVVVAIGDVLAVPATLGADVWLIVQTAVPAIVAIALAWSAARSDPPADGPRPEATLVVAGIVATVAGGVTRLGELTSSQLTNALPDLVVRATIAAGLVAIIPGLVALVWARLAGRRQVPAAP